MRVALLTGIAILMLSATAGLTSGFFGTSASAAVDAERHFRAALTLAPTSTIQMIQTAQELGYWVRIQTGPDVTYFDGAEACTECDSSQESLFFAAPRLYVDGSRFWLNYLSDELELNLRPLSESPLQYELIVSPVLPKTTLTDEDAMAINDVLSQFGLLVGAISLDSLESLVPTTKKVPPEDARIDSVLFNIIAQPDWNEYAMLNQISLSGMRTRVLVELASPNAQLPEELNLNIESQSENFARVQVMIHRLTELASQPAVGFVRLPSTPQPPGQ